MVWMVTFRPRETLKVGFGFCFTDGVLVVVSIWDFFVASYWFLLEKV